MRIAILGSGGVGGYVGARLQAAGEDVAFIARGPHLQAMRQGGLRIDCPQQPLHLLQVFASEHPSDIGPVDLVVFAVKLWDTDAAAQAIAPMLSAHTRVLTLQNGIDSVAMISRHVAPEQVRGGVIYVSAVIDRPGVIGSPGGMHAIVADAADGDPCMAALAAAAQRAQALDVKLRPDIRVAIWEKFIALASISGTTSLLRARMGQILQHPDTAALQRELIDEAIAVARAAGHTVRPELAGEIMGRLHALPPAFRSSMSEDLERGKPLELRWLSGRLHALGAELGVPTPGHSAVYRGLVLHEHGQPAVAGPNSDVAKAS